MVVKSNVIRPWYLKYVYIRSFWISTFLVMQFFRINWYNEFCFLILLFFIFFTMLISLYPFPSYYPLLFVLASLLLLSRSRLRPKSYNLVRSGAWNSECSQPFPWPGLHRLGLLLFSRNKLEIPLSHFYLLEHQIEPSSPWSTRLCFSSEFKPLVHRRRGFFIAGSAVCMVVKYRRVEDMGGPSLTATAHSQSNSSSHIVLLFIFKTSTQIR